MKDKSFNKYKNAHKIERKRINVIDPQKTAILYMPTPIMTNTFKNSDTVIDRNNGFVFKKIYYHPYVLWALWWFLRIKYDKIKKYKIILQIIFSLFLSVLGGLLVYFITESLKK